MQKPRILLISAYDANSHRYWHQQLTNELPQFKWQLLALKSRYFAWRMGGNAMSLKHQNHQELSADYEVLLATSMTDLSTLLGIYPHLHQAKKLLYFHENQFAYPANKNQQGLAEIQLRSIYAAMVADELLFNSTYNRDSFINGVRTFIAQMPDGTPKNLARLLTTKSKIVPVPIKNDAYQQRQPPLQNKLLEVVWNHRWEHDKGPETLLELMRLCMAHEHIKFHLLGQQFKQIPAAMQTIINQHRNQCLKIGYVDSRQTYLNILAGADVVLSTSQHEFQGISMQEAVACGCLPIAPNRLVYPAYFPPENLYPSSNPKQEAASIFELLQAPRNLTLPNLNLSWHQLKALYVNTLTPHNDCH